MKRLIALLLILLISLPVVGLCGSIRLQQPAKTEPRALIQQVIDRLLLLARLLRPQELPSKVAVAGSKGFTAAARLPEKSAFAAGMSSARFQYATATDHAELLLESELEMRHTLELLVSKADSLDLRNWPNLAKALPEGLQVHYELGLWVEAMRIPVYAVHGSGKRVNADLLVLVTKDNLADLFLKQFEHCAAPSGVVEALRRLSVYKTRESISLDDLATIAGALETIISLYR